MRQSASFFLEKFFIHLGRCFTFIEELYDESVLPIDEIDWRWVVHNTHSSSDNQTNYKNKAKLYQRVQNVRRIKYFIHKTKLVP